MTKGDSYTGTLPAVTSWKEDKTIENRNTQSRIISRLFFHLLPVQVMIIAMGSINSIVDGVTASRGIGADAVSAIGLYYSMVRIFEAVTNVLLGGTAVLCGRYLGRGDTEKIRGMYSLNLTVTFIAGVILIIANTVLAVPVAGLLGANTPAMREYVAIYARGYAIGILPMLLTSQLASFLQMEHNYVRNYVGIALMIGFNVALNILFVFSMKMGLGGLALSTSISNWAYFLVLAIHFLKNKGLFSYSFSSVLWDKFWTMLRIGFPGAILVVGLALRYMVINRLLISYGGPGGLPAMSAFNMITGLFIAVGIGTGSVVRMLTSVFIGENDREGIMEVIRIAFTRVMMLCIALGILVLLFAGPLAGIFFSDHQTEAFIETKRLFAMYSVCIPLVLVCCINTNYFQALERRNFVNVVSIFDGFLGMVVPALILAPVMGAMGVWIALVVGIAVTACLGFIYSIICNGGIPRTLNEWLLIDKVLGPDNEPRLSVNISSMEEVASVAEKVERFCRENAVSGKEAMHVALCLEETAGNIVHHGFKAGEGSHSVDISVVLKNDRSAVITVRDDCVPFNPLEWAQITSGEKDPTANIGIRTVIKIAKDVTYQNLLGMNVLTIILGERR
ncbi:MAG: MATE family efflux transporter [Lachnospiraceae bacterium]|nr:MATE family efflux transporter [Lachnospiraceae bacterium]